MESRIARDRGLGQEEPEQFEGQAQTITMLPFSLAGYTYQDKPTLYFNYRIESGEATTTYQRFSHGPSCRHAPSRPLKRRCGSRSA